MLQTTSSCQQKQNRNKWCMSKNLSQYLLQKNMADSNGAQYE